MSEQPLRVLLVDDEAGLREPLAKFLREKHSYVVDTAADGEQAWLQVTKSENLYHVALIDDLLPSSAEEEPRSFGIELMRRIKSQASQTEVIIFTGWGMERALEALRAGAFRYLAKPFNLEELAITVQHAAEYQRLKGYAREKQALERLMETSTALLSSQDQTEVLNRILRGVQAIGFDRARLYLLADNGESLVGRAQVGMDERFAGVKWSVTDDCYMQNIIEDSQSHVFRREAGKPIHSEEFLDKDGVDEWACVPLILRGEVIGKLSVDNKHNRRPILTQELTPIALFASQAAATIELSRQKDQLERLIASSPNGIIAVDAKASVTAFNKQAEEILGYKADEVRGKPVNNLYLYPEEPRNIGKRLHSSADGRVANYETLVKSKDGQAIPILHSCTWLYDSNGERIGSVGYFEDLRPIKEKERRIELLLKANDIVAQAENMDDGLKSLAEMIVTLLDTTFCRIFLLDESNQFLVAKAVSVNPRYSEELDWEPGLGERTAVAEWQGLSDTLTKSGPFVLKIGARQSHLVLKEWSRRLKLKRGIRSLLVIPLRTKNRVVGLLDVGELRCWEEAPFSKEKKDLAAAIADQIVVLVDRIRLHEITERRSQLLRSSFEASNTLVSSKNPQQTLKEVVDQTCAAADASWVRLILIDEAGQKRNPIDVLAIAGANKELDVASVIRPNGLSMQVLRTGKAEVIEDANEHRDRISSFMVQEGSAAALCLPLFLQGKRIGVMWIHYDKPRHFSESEIDALQLYVNHAAIAYDGAQRVEELEQLSQAAQSMSKVSDLKQTLRTIVEEAAKMFEADFSTIWSYDSGRGQFLPEELVAVGYSEKEWQKFKEKEPQPGGWTYTALQEGWVSAPDLSNLEHTFLMESKREILKQYGIASFQAIALKVGDEPIGVLYVSYKQPRTFGEEDRRSLESFAAHAALALRNAKLLDQVSKAKTAARVVAQVTALGDHNATLNSIAKGTLEAVRCDAVVLYVYDQVTNKLDHPPTMVGVRYQDRATRYRKVLLDSIVYKMLESDEPYIVESITGDDLFKDSRFARDEGIESCMAITLKAAGQKVGMMFVNYHTPHRFTSEELTDIKLFADQAAVAVRNAQLHERIQRRARALQALHEAGNAVTSSLDLNTILNRIAEQAWRLAGCQDNQISFASIGLVEKMTARLVATYPPEELARARDILGEECYLRGEGNGRIGIVGRAIKTGEPQLAHDVTSDPDYWVCDPAIRSELTVPIKIGNDVIGVINVEHPDLNAFDEDDRDALESLAAGAAVAIHNARLFEDARELPEQKALVKLSKELLGTVKRQEILDRAVAFAAEVLDTDLSNIVLPDRDGNLIFAAATGWRHITIGKSRMGSGSESQTGYTVMEKEPVIVDNYHEEKRFTPPHIVFENSIQSGMSVPMFSGDEDEVVGAMLVHTRKPRQFSEADKTLLSLIANQTAIAIKSARQYEAIERKSAYLNALYEASKAITDSFALEPTQILDCIVQQAVECVIDSQGPAIGFGVVHLYNEVTDEVICESVYPLQGFPNLADRIGEKRFLGEGRIGITGRTVKTRQPQLVQDVSVDPDYIEFNPRTQSELAAPLLDQDKVIGVLSVESEGMEALDEDAWNTLQALAELAVITIRNARQYKELKETKGLVGSRTALAWTGMISSAWRHTIEMHAITIREQIQLLRPELARRSESERMAERLNMIERLANRILEKPITPPLSVEEEADSVSINDLIRNRTRQLWSNDPYKSVLLSLDLAIENSATTRASTEWLRRCVDVLIDNAIEATVTISERKIVIASRQVDGRAEISVTDNGRGISEEKLAQLFHEPIKKSRGDKGLGIGLLFAQTIVQTYGGDLRCGSTGPAGTTMIISLPLET